MYNKSNLRKLEKMEGLAPEVMKAFWAFDRAAVADGAIPVKYKELIAVAVAHTTQCPYCIDIHAGNARTAGASDAELVEAAMVAAALRAGAAVTHATHALADCAVVCSTLPSRQGRAANTSGDSGVAARQKCRV
jgi:AhpD family alkylhydroperoxidase